LELAWRCFFYSHKKLVKKVKSLDVVLPKEAIALRLKKRDLAILLLLLLLCLQECRMGRRSKKKD
jgi:hypothetical protein